MDYYSCNKESLSSEQRVALAEKCLTRVHAINKNLAKELAIFKDIPENSLERLFLDSSDVMHVRPSSSSTILLETNGFLPSGHRQICSADNSNSRRGPRLSRHTNSRKNNGRDVNFRSDQQNYTSSETHHRLIRAFNLKLHHAEQQACESHARTAVLESQLSKLQRDYESVVVRGLDSLSLLQ